MITMKFNPQSLQNVLKYALDKNPKVQDANTYRKMIRMSSDAIEFGVADIYLSGDELEVYMNARKTMVAEMMQDQFYEDEE